MSIPTLSVKTKPRLRVWLDDMEVPCYGIELPEPELPPSKIPPLGRIVKLTILVANEINVDTSEE